MIREYAIALEVLRVLVKPRQTACHRRPYCRFLCHVIISCLIVLISCSKANVHLLRCHAGRRSHRKARVDPSLNYLLVLNCSRLLLALSGSSGVLSGSNRNVGFRPRSTPTRETFRGSLFSGFALNFIVFSTFLGFNNSYAFSWVWAPIKNLLSSLRPCMYPRTEPNKFGGLDLGVCIEFCSIFYIL